MTARRPYRKPTVRTVPRPPVTDAELVQRTLAGDREAWGELYLRFRRLVARELGRVLWRARLRKREDLDEAIQEWWAYAALDALRQWRPARAGLSTYLTIRSHGWATNYLKRLRPGYGGPGPKSTRDPQRIALARASTIPSEAVRPDHAAEDFDFRASVRRAALSCVRTIRERAAIMRLLNPEEPTQKEQAAELGVSYQAIQHVERRLLERIRPRLVAIAA